MMFPQEARRFFTGSTLALSSPSTRFARRAPAPFSLKLPLTHL